MSVQAPPRRTAPRVPPRRKRPRRSAWRTIWPLVKFVVAATVVALLLGKVVRPFRLYDTETRATRQLEHDLQTLRMENALLERRIKYLQTPKGAAQAARKLGWVRPGEVTLVLPPEGDGAKRK
ncbi:MAG: septum formation initiator family protein [Armatimonadetes bacterium]|nr:septum formation initiator family protein [Armatimonadota bacterium]